MTTAIFHDPHYLRHNDRRLRHLDTLDLLKPGMTVLEVGAGIGDHTKYLLSKGCLVTATEGRQENLDILRTTFPLIPTKLLDLNIANPPFESGFDVVCCYGTLYHLSRPDVGIEFMARHGKLMLLETCVSYGNDSSVCLCQENQKNPSQALYGIGCRPTRPWVFSELKKHYPFVYVTKTQPNHDEFPSDWTVVSTGLHRAVFVASIIDLENNNNLISSLPDRQNKLEE